MQSHYLISLMHFFSKKIKIFIIVSYVFIISVIFPYKKLVLFIGIDYKEYKRVKKIVNEYERNKNKSVYYYGKKKGIFLSPPTIIIYKNIISKYEKQNK